jgi:WD40 repeat protein
VFIPEAVIGIENLNRLAPIARWGKGNVVQVLISPSGERTAVATPGGVYLYRSETLEETQFIESKSWLSSIAFAPNETLLAVGSLDGSVQILQVADGARQKTFSSPLGSITSLAFSTTGNMLAAGDATGGIYVFDVATQAARTLTGHGGRIHTLIFSPDGQTLISGSEDCTVRIWQVSTGALDRTITVKTKSLDAISLRPVLARF